MAASVFRSLPTSAGPEGSQSSADPRAVYSGGLSIQQTGLCQGIKAPPRKYGVSNLPRDGSER